MLQDVVHSILKDYTETKRFFCEKPSKLKNLTLLFSVAINDRINALMFSSCKYYWATNVILPRGKSKLQSGRWYEC